MTDMQLQPELKEFASDLRFAVRVSPYRRGLEDAMYEQVFANPFPIGSDEWNQYNAGNADARKAKQAERTQH